MSISRGFRLHPGLGRGLAFVAMIAAVAMFLVAALGANNAGGADHADAPLAASDRAADLADVYAFRSPERPDNLVVALTVNPLTAPAANASVAIRGARESFMCPPWMSQ